MEQEQSTTRSDNPNHRPKVKAPPNKKRGKDTLDFTSYLSGRRIS